MTVVEEIRQIFEELSEKYGVKDITTLPEAYPAKAIVNEDGYSVFVFTEEKKEIFEKFSGSIFSTESMMIDGKVRFGLMLTCPNPELSYEFAALSYEFVNPGNEGENRKFLIENPLVWYDKWKQLLGNSIKNKNVVSIIAEMAVFAKLYSKDDSYIWLGGIDGYKDIENLNDIFIVKGSKSKTNWESSFVVQSTSNYGKHRSLVYCHLQKSDKGKSINDYVKEIVSLGYDEARIEEILSKHQFDLFSSIRDEKYVILESRIFDMDQNFPLLTKENFVDSRIPAHVIEVSYKVDLADVEYKPFSLEYVK